MVDSTEPAYEASFDLAVVFMHGKSAMFLNHSKWQVDKNQQFLSNKDHIFAYCQRKYPKKKVINIAPAYKNVTIGGWCKYREKECNGRDDSSQSVKPFICMTSETKHKIALRVSKVCRYTFKTEGGKCQSYETWIKRIPYLCFKESQISGTELHAKTMTFHQPCQKLMSYKFIELVCCPKENINPAVRISNYLRNNSLYLTGTMKQENDQYTQVSNVIRDMYSKMEKSFSSSDPNLRKRSEEMYRNKTAIDRHVKAVHIWRIVTELGRQRNLTVSKLRTAILLIHPLAPQIAHLLSNQLSLTVLDMQHTMNLFETADGHKQQTRFFRRYLRLSTQAERSLTLLEKIPTLRDGILHDIQKSLKSLKKERYFVISKMIKQVHLIARQHLKGPDGIMYSLADNGQLLKDILQPEKTHYSVGQSVGATFLILVFFCLLGFSGYCCYRQRRTQRYHRAGRYTLSGVGCDDEPGQTGNTGDGAYDEGFDSPEADAFSSPIVLTTGANGGPVCARLQARGYENPAYQYFDSK